MSDGPLSFQRSWDGFLHPNTVVMAKRGAPVVRPTTTFRFGFEAPDLANLAARDLLDKILAALELAPGDYSAFSRAPGDFASRILVRFSAGESEAALAGAWNGNTLTTFSLQAMIANPGLKKPVWAHLKDAIGRERG